MTQTLIKVGPGGEMQSSVAPSVAPESAILWVSGENVIFRKMGVEKMPGYETIVDVGEDGYEIAQALVDGVQTAYIGAARRVYRYNATVGLQNLMQFAGTGAIRLETWGDWFLATNGVNPIRLFKNGAFQTIADISFTYCKHLLRSNVHMLAANTSNGENMIEWCAASDVETWTPARSNSAGNYVIRDLGGEITCMTKIGRQIALYSEDKMVTGRWTGQPFTFSFDDPMEGIGAAGGRSVVSVGAFNIGMFRNGIWETDGTQYRLVDEPDVQKWIQDTVDFDQPERITAYHNKTLEQAIFHMPKLAGGMVGLPYNYRRRAFGPPITTGVTGITKREVFDYPLAMIGGKLSYINGTNAAGAALTSKIQTKPMDAGDSTLRKIFDYLQLSGSWTGGTVRVGALEDPNDLSSIEWFYSADLARQHWFERDTPFVVLEFSASDVDETFAISQFLMGGEVTGFVA